MIYHFDFSQFTIGDQLAVVLAAKNEDIGALLHIAERCTKIDIFALSYTELPSFLQQFSRALNDASQATNPVWKMIQQSLKGDE